MWNADNASQMDAFDRDTGDEIAKQFSEWQQSLVKLISFTAAGSAAGALVQLALAVEVLDDVKTFEPSEMPGELVLRVDRLVRSALSAMMKSTAIDDATWSVVTIYSNYPTATDFISLGARLSKPRTSARALVA